MKIIINNIQKAESFAALFQHIKLITDNINIMFEKDRLYVQSMDQARVSIFEIIIPRTWFDEYSVDESINLGINSSYCKNIKCTRQKSVVLEMTNIMNNFISYWGKGPKIANRFNNISKYLSWIWNPNYWLL